MPWSEFKEADLKKLVKPKTDSNKSDNGQVIIIGGSKLFHGAPIFSLKVASRIVDMVFFASPDPGIGEIAAKLKSQLNSFIWVPFEEVEEYLKKSDAILIGPGLMRYRKEKGLSQKKQTKVWDKAGRETKKITEKLIKKFPNKQWVVDAGSLQVMEAEDLPPQAIITPNEKEFELLFNIKPSQKTVSQMAKKHQLIIVSKNIKNLVCSPEKCVEIKGGNPGLTKGGTGDVLAGLIVALAAKNPAFLSAQAGCYLTKKAADELYKKVGFSYNADDLADEIPRILGQFWR